MLHLVSFLGFTLLRKREPVALLKLSSWCVVAVGFLCIPCNAVGWPAVDSNNRKLKKYILIYDKYLRK